MLAQVLITVLLLGDSQTNGDMGMLLQQHYENHGVHVIREAAGGKGVNYFLSATRPPASRKDEKLTVSARQKTRIRHVLKDNVEYIIFGSLGGNDAVPGCCHGKNRAKLLARYKRLYKQLCSYNAIVIFNGSPIAQKRRLRKFDKRRALVDQIQKEAALGTCVIHNSVRGMSIPPDPDGYHYNKSARLYVEYLMELDGMMLPIVEAN